MHGRIWRWDGASEHSISHNDIVGLENGWEPSLGQSMPLDIPFRHAQETAARDAHGRCTVSDGRTGRPRQRVACVIALARINI